MVIVTMFVVVLSLAGHFVPRNLRGVYMQPLPTQTTRQRSAKARRQPAACTAVPRLRRRAASGTTWPISPAELQLLRAVD